MLWGKLLQKQHVEPKAQKTQAKGVLLHLEHSQGCGHKQSCEHCPERAGQNPGSQREELFVLLVLGKSRKHGSPVGSGEHSTCSLPSPGSPECCLALRRELNCVGANEVNAGISTH